jgi:hypothetical protein
MKASAAPSRLFSTIAACETWRSLSKGHENAETTQIYIHADMRMKEKALARIAAAPTPSGRFRPDDQLLAFLEGL